VLHGSSLSYARTSVGHNRITGSRPERPAPRLKRVGVTLEPRCVPGGVRMCDDAPLRIIQYVWRGRRVTAEQYSGGRNGP
jgi:hypothetical protein